VTSFRDRKVKGHSNRVTRQNSFCFKARLTRKCHLTNKFTTIDVKCQKLYWFAAQIRIYVYLYRLCMQSAILFLPVLSVLLSVQCCYCIKMNWQIVTLFWHSGRGIILVFRSSTAITKLQGETVRDNYRGWENLANIAICIGNGTIDWPPMTLEGERVSVDDRFLSVSILMAIFPDGPGLACTTMSPFRILLELMVMEVVVTAGAIRRQNVTTNKPTPSFLQVGCPSCRRTDSVRAPKN